MKLSLVIPCYNEAANLPSLLERCKILVSESREIEVVLVDNGSTDNTPSVMSSLLPRYPQCRCLRVEENKGYGFGILQGLEVCRGEYLGWTHADMQTDPQDALRALSALESQEEQVFIKGRRYGRPFSDVLFTVFMSLFESVLLSRPMWDINAQPTVFPRSFYDSWTSPPLDFSLDLYAYYNARVSRMAIMRFPVKFGEREHGVSHWNVNWKAKKRFIERTIKFSFQLKREVSRWN